MENSVCAEWDAIPDGELAMPVDDDDWFAPHAATVLETEREPGITAYHWLRSFLEVPTSFRHRLHLIARHTVGLPMPFLFITNNYAFVKRPEYKPLMTSHVQASDWAKSAPPGSVKKIEQWLSTMNRNLGSQTQLRHMHSRIDRSELIRKLKGYRRLYREPPTPELASSRPYRVMMSQLMDELQIKGR
ncbi:MAG: hypothetical protein WEA81_07010 [Dehalococcoidia bacterium]